MGAAMSAEGSSEIVTTNITMVSTNGRTFTALRGGITMTPDQALVHAAWLVAMAEPFAEHSFAEVLEAVRNT